MVDRSKVANRYSLNINDAVDQLSEGSNTSPEKPHLAVLSRPAINCGLINEVR
jgi:hypothetical protein